MLLIQFSDYFLIEIITVIITDSYKLTKDIKYYQNDNRLFSSRIKLSLFELLSSLLQFFTEACSLLQTDGAAGHIFHLFSAVHRGCRAQ